LTDVCIDASIAAKWILAEPDTAVALALRARLVREAARFVAPLHFSVEVTSAVYGRVRDGIVTLDSAQGAVSRLRAIPVRLTAPPQLGPRAIAIADGFRWKYAYDAFYLALAELLDCDLWTADARLHRDASARFPRLRLLSEFR